MDSTVLSRKRRFRVGFLAGLGAGIVATGVMLLLNLTWHGISLPEVFGSELTALMPISMFNYLHELIGGNAKYYLFYIILIGQCLVFALSAALYNLRFKHARLQWYYGLLLTLILWLLVGFGLLPVTGSGIFGSQLNVGVINTMLSLAVVGLVFGLLFVFARNWLIRRTQVAKPVGAGVERSGVGTLGSPTDTDSSDEIVSRRTLFKRGAVVAGIGVLGVGLWYFITSGPSPRNSAQLNQILQHFKRKIVPPPTPNYGELQPVPYLSPEVTSNDQYYIVSKNLFSDPTVDGATWHLTVDGQVDNPLTLSYQDVLALPMQQQYESMMCVSNEVGGQYMSNALWEGVRLMDLLQRAGVKPGATKVVFHAADDYTDSIHLTKALEPTTLMAVHMNNATLPMEHGFPARMLVPGIYGMKHCKWLTRIEVVNYNFQGYWQQRGWDDAAPIRMTARIDVPLDGTTLVSSKPTYIAGVAFSGTLGISEVDVSLDGGQNWQRATLKQPLSNLTWVLWELAWHPQPGNYLISARAIDLEGNVQDPKIAPPLPSGSSGYHTINVTVS